MRYALVTETFPPEINGVSMTLGRLSDFLKRRGETLQLIAPYREDRVVEVEGFETCWVKGFRIPKYPELRFGFPAIGKLKRFWKVKRPDVIHIATEGPLGWAAARAAKGLGIPYITSYHTNFHQYGSHYGFGFVQRWVMGWLRYFHNQGQLTFVPSEDTLGVLAQEQFANLRILSRGIDTELFSSKRRSQKLRREWGMGEDDPVAIYVGRVAGEKNLPLTVAAWKEMKRLLPKLKLVVVGDGPYRTELEGTDPDIILTGAKRGESLAEHYASGDCFLFASTTETFGNVVTEAMASGLVVLAFHYAAPAQFIQDGHNGFTVPMGDEDAYLERAKYLAKYRSRWKSVGENAMESVQSHSWEELFEAFVDQVEAHLDAGIVETSNEEKEASSLL